METFGSSVSYLKDVVVGISNSKLQDIASTRNLYMALCKVHATAKIAPQTELAANSNLIVFEDALLSKFIQLNKSMQVLVGFIYDLILSSSPGYVARSVVNSLLSICNSKTSPIGSRECAVSVIGSVMEKRPMDLGSLINDVIAAMTKLFKGSDVTVRIASIDTLIKVVSGAGSKIGDCHLELAKLASKSITDKSVDVRYKVAILLSEIAKHSSSFASVAVDILLPPALKGLEEEVAIVQRAFASTVSTIYFELIKAHNDEQEQAKIGLARGGAAEDGAPKKPDTRTSITKLKDISLMKDIMVSSRKSPDGNDVRSVVRLLVRNLARPAVTARSGHVEVLLLLVKQLVPTLEKADFEWLVRCIIAVLRDPTVIQFGYEELVLFRSRLTYLFRTAITSLLPESHQIMFAGILIELIGQSSTDTKTEHELQLVLGEISHIVTALGEAVAPLCENIKVVANQHLKHSSFGVRAASAYVLASIATVVPVMAAVFLREALHGATLQSKLLLSFEDGDYAEAKESDVSNESDDAHGNVGGSPRRSPKDTERMQRMYCFHGHTLVISILLKNERWLPTGLATQLFIEAFDFALEMLSLDVHAAPPPARQVVCSIIRAGSLIVSSCLNMGYRAAKPRIKRLMDCCTTLLLPTAQNSPANPSGQGLLYELMSIEAALVCISTLLWFCADALVYDENCLVSIVDGLENAFRAIKTKYQPKFRNHFRFRTLHVILLECFAWLPPGSFPATCPQIFVEALRVFRDSISAGYECTCLSDFVLAEHEILQVAGVSKPAFSPFPDAPLTESIMVMRLESFSVALQKKESEAFQASFSKQVHMPEFNRTPLHATDWVEPSPPCAFIDSRTVDASIALIAATFGHQTNEYQEKAIQLCSQAIAQHFKAASTTLGLFASDEEKRKKDKKSYVTIKNVAAALSAIIRSFPFHNGMSLELDLQWVQTVAERMFEMLSSPSAEIRSVSSSALGVFCSKIFGAQLMDAMTHKLVLSIKTAQEKRESMAECSGYMLALSSLWQHSKNNANVQHGITTVVFDCLRRTECSFHFRAHSVFALASILRYRFLDKDSTDIGNDVNDVVALLEKTIQAIEVQLLCLGSLAAIDISQLHDHELLLVCLQRLVNVTAHIALDLDPTSAYMRSLIKFWRLIRNSCSHSTVEYESAQFILVGSVMAFDIDDLEDACMFIKNILESHLECSVNHILKAVICTRTLITKNSSLVCKVGIDVQLFKLLDWCVASTTVICSPSYWGVELRSGLDNILGNTRALQAEIEATLESLVAIEVERAPDNRAARWVLLCRAIAMSLRSSSQGNDDPSKKTENDDEGVAGDSAKARADEFTPLQFTALCRDKALELSAEINSTRLRVKIVALRCATTAAVGALKNRTQSDAAEAKKVIAHYISALNPKDRQEQLENIPCFLALYLHDLVNLACACAAFSIEDHRMIGLQTAAMEFLQVIVNLFWEAGDVENSSLNATAKLSSDAISTAAKDKILFQFIAQLVSAIRPCLNAQWSPNLLWTSGELVFTLIGGGMLNDKVVIKRIIKAMFHVVENSEEKYEVRCTTSLEVAGSVSSTQHIINTANLARIYLLTTPFATWCEEVEGSVQDMLRATISPHESLFVSVWTSMAIDASRALQGNPQWPKETPVTDFRRGGITYDSSIDVTKLTPHLEFALPFITASACMSSYLPDDRVSIMFAISTALIDHLYSTNSSKSNVVHKSSEVSLLKASLSVLEPMLLCGIIALARRSSGKAFIKCGEWSQLVAFLTEEVVSSSTKTSRRTLIVLCSLLAELIDVLSTHLTIIVSAANKDNGNHAVDESELKEINTLNTWLWIGSVQLAKILFKGHCFASSGNGHSVAVGFSRRMFPEFLTSPYQVASQEQDGSSASTIQSITPIALLFSSLSRIIHVWSCIGSSVTVFVEYLLRFFSLVFPFIAVVVVDQTQKDTLTSQLLLSLSLLSSNMSVAKGASQALIGLVMRDVVKWQLDWSSKSMQHEVCTLPATFENIYSVFWLVFTCAIQFFSQDGERFGSSGSVEVVVAASTADSTQWCRAVIVAAIRINQSKALEESRIISAIVLPSVFCRMISSTGLGDEAVDTLAMQYIFMTFNGLAGDDQRTAFVSSLMDPLCQMVKRHTIASSFSMFCGKAITHIARTFPAIFKEQIGSMNDENRMLLMSLMKIALQSMDQPSTDTSTSDKTGSQSGLKVKKIDISKYKVPTQESTN